MKICQEKFAYQYLRLSVRRNPVKQDFFYLFLKFEAYELFDGLNRNVPLKNFAGGTPSLCTMLMWVVKFSKEDTK